MSDITAASLDRRSFAGRCAAAALAPLVAACASLVARPVTPVNGKIELTLLHYPELARPGGSLKLQPSGGAEPVYALVLDNGEVAALSPTCTHLGCTVEIQGPVLVCPCHGSTYDRTGNVLRGPAVRSLAHYHVDRSADMITIDLLRRS
ncbi:MAG: ubiquinol-cytochrome c reductase iron-sulfur subunit [Gemmatimonadota bacterium]